MNRETVRGPLEMRRAMRKWEFQTARRDRKIPRDR